MLYIKNPHLRSPAGATQATILTGKFPEFSREAMGHARVPAETRPNRKTHNHHCPGHARCLIPGHNSCSNHRGLAQNAKVPECVRRVVSARGNRGTASCTWSFGSASPEGFVPCNKSEGRRWGDASWWAVETSRSREGGELLSYRRPLHQNRRLGANSLVPWIYCLLRSCTVPGTVANRIVQWGYRQKMKR